MWPVSVVVAEVGVQETHEMTAVEHDGPIEALGPDGLDPPLRKSVGLRRPDRGQDHPCTLSREYLVEGASELRIPVANEEAHGRPAF